MSLFRINQNRFKLIIFVPFTHTQAVLSALKNAGAGNYSDKYDSCFFISRGTGHYRNVETDTQNQRPEIRIETVCDFDKLNDVLESVRNVHPDKDLGFDVIPLLSRL
jgi:hypothetical protein